VIIRVWSVSVAETCTVHRIARKAKSFLAHYLPAAYGYRSEVLLRAVRIAIRP